MYVSAVKLQSHLQITFNVWHYRLFLISLNFICNFADTKNIMMVFKIEWYLC
jgi:hypothetical protein